MINFSICMSSIRPQYWETIAESLKSNVINYEVIMVGPNEGPVPEHFKYIKSNVKPAQCYEQAFRASQGEYLCWSADDTTYSEHALDNMYGFLKCFANYKVVGAFRAIEDGGEITSIHHLIGRNTKTPVMAPFGVIDRKLYEEIGGYDKNFVCGQSENDLVMRAYEIGGKVEICPNAYAIAEHRKIHQGKTTFRQEFYGIDRDVLERAWIDINGQVSKTRLLKFKPFEEKDLQTISQGLKGKWQ